MSSMRNARQRRTYKERAQPLEREKWGLLEKHKDYSLRAKDYNAKKARLQVLRQKAAERNPDEFSYSMLSSSSKQGKKRVDRQNPVLDHHVVKLLKTQDLGYVQTMLQTTRQHIARMEDQTVVNGHTGSDLSQDTPGQKVVFVHDQQQQRDLARRDPNDRTEPPDIVRKSPVTREEKRAEKARQLRRHTLRTSEKSHRTNTARLALLKEREKVLRDAEIELDLQRAKMSNSVGGTNRAGVKWRVRERKR